MGDRLGSEVLEKVLVVWLWTHRKTSPATEESTSSLYVDLAMLSLIDRCSWKHQCFAAPWMAWGSPLIWLYRGVPESKPAFPYRRLSLCQPCWSLGMDAEGGRAVCNVGPAERVPWPCPCTICKCKEFQGGQHLWWLGGGENRVVRAS